MNESTQPTTEPTKSKTKIIIAVIIIVLLIILLSQMGFYTIQPIGALPDGVTLLIWRTSSNPFFNSPDAVCLKIQQGVSLLCRGLAMRQAPVDRIILRLPYMDWAYLISTSGQTFER
jgi:hypothetical protein